MTTDHKPSRACHLRGCDQPACRNEHLRYCKRYQYDTAHAGPRTVAAAPYITHVQALVADGWTHAAIAADTAVGITTIRDLAAGEARHIHRDTAAALDRHHPADVAPTWWVDCTGTIRRLRALTVMGWPQHAIAAQLGLGYSTVRAIANGRRRSTPRHTAQAVADLYAQWCRRPGPSPAAAGRARARGWHGPLAWDANTIDEPGAEPDTQGRGVDGKRKRDCLRNDEIRHLAGFQFSAHTIAKQVGLPVKDVEGRLAKIRAEKAEAAA
jgi:hypothetical protein